MKILEKIIVLTLCVILILSINTRAHANILDTIIGNDSEVDTEEAEDTSKESNEATSTPIFSDIEDHWAKEWINYGIKAGFVSGYEDGTFKPDRTISRAEFSTLLNKALEIQIREEVNFSDISEEDWFYEEVQKSLAVGFFTGYENNTFRPNNPIKREEAAKVVAGAITTGNLEGEGASLLKDYATIQDWARASVNTVYNKGYILGYPDKSYRPGQALTRGEAVKIISEILENENIEHGFNITNYNESYTSTLVVGNLNILDSVGSGNVYIKNVVVLGDIVISAKSVSSVELTDVRARNIIFEGERNPVKIVQ